MSCVCHFSDPCPGTVGGLLSQPVCTPELPPHDIENVQSMRCSWCNKVFPSVVAWGAHKPGCNKDREIVLGRVKYNAEAKVTSEDFTKIVQESAEAGLRASIE